MRVLNRKTIWMLIVIGMMLLWYSSIPAFVLPEVLYLPMDGNSEAEALKDHSGNNIEMSTHGDPTWESSGGHDGNGAFVFDGDDDLSAGENFPTSSSYTKTVWVYRTGSGLNGGNNIISGDANSGGHALWAPDTYGNKLSAGHNGGGGQWQEVQDSGPIELNTWYFVALTYNHANGEMILYKNSVAVDNTIMPEGKRQVTDATISIGSFGHQNGWMIQGKIDDVRIYNRALSAEEINGIFTGKEKAVKPNCKIAFIWGNLKS